MVLAGGCFWCVEHDMRSVPGVVKVISGYSGGEIPNPTYENHPGHREAILVEYDDAKTNYKKLLHFFIDNIDPTDRAGQFADRGSSYAPAIFYENSDEETVARAVIEEVAKSGVYDGPIMVDIIPRKLFYKAEEYHQDYAAKNPLRYQSYRQGSGREVFVKKVCQIRQRKKIDWSN